VHKPSAASRATEPNFLTSRSTLNSIFNGVYWGSGVMNPIFEKQKDFIVHDLNADSWGKWMGDHVINAEDKPSLIH